MTTKVQTGPGPLDTVKLLLAALVLLGGIVAYYYFEDESILLRAAGVLIGLALGVVIAMQSVQGQALWQFIQGARVELIQVIWPTRQEAMQTTLTVLVFVLILGIFFWGLDFFLLWGSRTLTGRGA
ncbi:MAG: preprotein translocase subunit SecE [Pseudomonadota bacterium]|nr:preprotein translocase subunit SecE [Pseudomonadota bacterium]